jgi:hypothetical protein
VGYWPEFPATVMLLLSVLRTEVQTAFVKPKEHIDQVDVSLNPHPLAGEIPLVQKLDSPVTDKVSVQAPVQVGQYPVVVSPHPEAFGATFQGEGHELVGDVGLEYVSIV